MSDTVKVEVKGGAELDAALVSLDRKVSNKFIIRGLRAGAKIIQRAAQANTHDVSGTTRQSIKVRAGKRRKARKTMLVTVRKDNFSGPSFYAAFEEFGHKVGSRKLGDKRRQVQGLHFMERAGDQKKNDAVQAVTDSLKSDLGSFKPGGDS